MMTEFLYWHPSSKKAEELYDNRHKLSSLLYQNPPKGIKLLRKEWKFGEISELWDDYVFENCLRPVFNQNEKADIKDAVNRYSVLDHSLFLPYVRREENAVRFRRAFWNINFYGLRLSKKLQRECGLNDIPQMSVPSSNKIKIAFVLKGPYKLAHVEFLHSFLNGCSIFADYVQVFLILIDDAQSAPKGLNHISILSVSDIQDPYHKIKAYQKLCHQYEFNHICWVAPIQNISLYMGMQLAECQSYWSMKYHSIIMPSLQKYAGLGFGGKSFDFDDKQWFRGRAFPDLQMPDRDQAMINKLKASHQIPLNSIIIGCFVRAEKLHDEAFWDSIFKILNFSENVHFVLASQSIPEKYLTRLKSHSAAVQIRFHQLGWINTKHWAYVLDIYYDSSPRGSCNTIFEAIEAGAPVLLADSAHNRESSALPYLASAAHSKSIADDKIPGIFYDENQRLNKCFELISNEERRLELITKQRRLLDTLKGRQHLFAKDYLNYFLDSSFKLSDV